MCFRAIRIKLRLAGQLKVRHRKKKKKKTVSFKLKNKVMQRAGSWE